MSMRDRLIEALALAKECFSATVGEFEAGEKPTGGERDWNLRDTVCHVNEWIAYAGRKLGAIAAGAVFDEVTDWASFNRAAYEKHLGTGLAQAGAENARLLDELAGIVARFPERDFSRTDLPLGFDMPLWQYVLMDGCVHPVEHLLYYCLKRHDTGLFFALFEKTEAVFSWYSRHDRSVYSFREFFSNDEECYRFFTALRPPAASAAQKRAWETVRSVNVRRT
jgi:hypothetical protein